MRAAIPLFLITLVSCAAVAVGCGDDDADGTSSGTTTGTTTTSSGTAGGGGTGEAPNFPMIGEQVERMGRPAINTATNHTFDPDEAAKGAAKDEWNKAGPMDWAGFRAQVADNLGILDSLDANCGNQFLAGPNPTADRYDALAAVLADDRLWVNLNADTCTTYLAVEANFTGAIDNNDCGGRRLPDDVIKTSYSLLAAGDLTFSIDDTNDADPVKTGGEAFPYLAPPQ
jgi:hypothetical protein